MKDRDIFSQKKGRAGFRQDSEKTRHLGKDCIAEAERFLRTQVADLFNQIDDVLFDRAKTVAGDSLEASYFDAIQSLRRYREIVSEAFVAIVDESMVEFWTHITDHSISVEQAAEKAGLSLMEDEDLEENIAVANIVSKAEKSFEKELADRKSVV